MFANTIREIRPDLADGDVTMVVKNFSTETEVRGWHGDGVDAVRLLGDLVEDPIEAIQQHAELAHAARTLAAHANELTKHGPKFKRGRKKARVVDEVFVKTMRSAGSEAIRAQIAATPNHMTGNTIVYSPVIRVGKTDEGGKVWARIRIEGKYRDVEVDQDLVESIWEIAKRETTCEFKVTGRWEEDDAGALHLAAPRIVEVNQDYSPWSGRQILEASHELTHLFTRQDFEEMLADLQPEDMG